MTMSDAANTGEVPSEGGSYDQQVEQLFAILHGTLKVHDGLNPLDHVGIPFPIELMNPNPSSRRTKDGAKYLLAFEVTAEVHEFFMSARETAGMVISGVVRVDALNGKPSKPVRPLKTLSEKIADKEAKISSALEVDNGAADILRKSYPKVSAMAGEWSNHPLFWQWLKSIGEMPDGVDYPDGAANFIRKETGCVSRNDLDADATRRSLFFEKVSAPFRGWLGSRRKEA